MDGELRARYRSLFRHLDERGRRLIAAADAERLGRGGVSAVARSSGLSRPTIHKGLEELHAPPMPVGRVRRPGAGRKRAEVAAPEILGELELLIAPATRGDPMSPLRWTSKSTRHLADALAARGHAVSHETVAQLLQLLGYSLQASAKTIEGRQHPDRNAQFEYINQVSRRFLRRGWPVISVDTKKKELIGKYAPQGREWRRSGRPVRVRVHDFIDPDIPKAIPYGVVSKNSNRGR